MKREYDGMVATEWQCVYIEIWRRHERLPSLETKSLEVVNWCYEYEGKGKFYCGNPIFGIFYFECDEDYTMFALMWK
jgi:hypothetical protein